MKQLLGRLSKFLFIGLVFASLPIYCLAETPENQIMLEGKYFWMEIAEFPKADRNQQETDYIIHPVYDQGIKFNEDSSFIQFNKIQNVRPETWRIIMTGDWEIVDKNKLGFQPFGESMVIYKYEIYEVFGILYMDLLREDDIFYEHVHFVKYPREIHFGKSNEIYIRPMIGAFTRVLKPEGF